MKWGVNMGSINYHTSEYITLAVRLLEIAITEIERQLNKRKERFI